MLEVQQIVVGDESLNAVTSDNLFKKINIPLEEGSPVEINLQKIKFVDPYGLVALCLAGRQLWNKSKNLSVILPDDFDCQSYLRAMGFVKLAESFAQVKNTVDGSASGQQLSQQVVLELTKIEKKEKVPHDDIKNVLERLSTILNSELNFGEKEVSDLTNIVSELCYNIKDHSKDEGFVAVQRYQRRLDNKRYVVIGVGDLGVGIKSSLGARYDVSSWSHFDAIVQALKKEFSAYPNRGLGLYMVSKIAKDYGGALHIRSGDSRLYLRHNARGSQTVQFPGTQVSISLSELA
ncbi:MAG: ATP-binding protein [Candidatus Omnitrophota bacterium]